MHRIKAATPKIKNKEFYCNTCKKWIPAKEYVKCNVCSKSICPNDKDKVQMENGLWCMRCIKGAKMEGCN